MLRHFRRLAPLAVLAVLAAGCEGSNPTAAAPSAAPAKALLTNQAPTAVANLTVVSTQYCQAGTCVYNYKYDAFQSSDPDGTIVAYQWKVDGSVVSTSATWNVTALRAYEACTGNSRGVLTVTDNEGATGTVCFGLTYP